MAGTGMVGPGALAGAKPTWWRSLDGLRTALVVLLACTGAASIAFAVAIVNRLDVIDDLESGGGFGLFERANDADDAVDATAGFVGFLALATAVVFIIWQWRCAKNAELLGCDRPRFGPGWSIGGWFIPFANLVIPALVMQDLWRASSPGARPGAWRSERASWLIGVWWIVFIVGGIASRVTLGDDEAASLSELRTDNQIMLAGAVVTVAAAALAIAVVVQLTRRFDARYTAG